MVTGGVDLLIGLSPRERQVLEYIVDGYTCDQIACLMDLSSRTVDIYTCSIRRKLGAQSMIQAVIAAARMNIIEL